MSFRVRLTELNAMDADAFTLALDGVFEHSPWIARAAHAARPFAAVAQLHAAMLATMREAGAERQRDLLAAHPELGRPASLTAASAAEQAGHGLDRLADDEAAGFAALNAAYRARFGFPFIIAVRGQRDRATILEALRARLANPTIVEHTTALAEVAKIARFRLDDRVEDDGS